MQKLSTKKAADTRLRASGASVGLAEGINPPVGQLYNRGGRNWAFSRSGTGGPPVVFLPGAGRVGLPSLNIKKQVPQFTTLGALRPGGNGRGRPGEPPENRR